MNVKAGIKGIKIKKKIKPPCVHITHVLRKSSEISLSSCRLPYHPTKMTNNGAQVDQILGHNGRLSLCSMFRAATALGAGTRSARCSRG